MLRNKHHSSDPVWHVQLILLVLVAFQLVLPDSLIPWPRFLVPAIEILLVAALYFVTPKTATFSSKLRRLVVMALIIIVAIVNIGTLQILVQALVTEHHITPQSLLLSALSVYATTSIIFSLLYWEMDGGGPGSRRGIDLEKSDFLFPQQNLQKTEPRWHPTFIDYLYVSITNMAAFSPTDTMPLSRRAKILMAIQAMVSLGVVILVAGRAINTL